MAAYPDAFSNDHPCKCILDVIEIAVFTMFDTSYTANAEYKKASKLSAQYGNAWILADNHYTAKFNMLQAIEGLATSTDEEKKTARDDCENARLVSDECDSIYRQGVATTLSLVRKYNDVMDDATSLAEAYEYIIDNYKQ